MLFRSGTILRISLAVEADESKWPLVAILDLLPHKDRLDISELSEQFSQLVLAPCGVEVLDIDIVADLREIVAFLELVGPDDKVTE